MKDVFILGGPTAVGKTDISIKLAKILNGEIISADSMQIYKYMDIGSAKINKEEMQGVPHYMIDIITPDKSFSVVQFKEAAKVLIDDITERGKLPMIVGGTGFFIDSLIFNYKYTDADKDEKYRIELERLANTKSKEFVHSLLKNIDEESYNRLYPNDLKRVIRALEVYKSTGKTISQYNSEQNLYDIPYNIDYFVLTMNRKELYERINKRVDIMLDRGLLDEVTNLKKMGYTSDMQSMKGIGYKEILNYLNDEVSLEDAIYQIKKGSRNYAKRQLTWFRKDNRVNWINKDQFHSEKEIIEEILGKMKK